MKSIEEIKHELRETLPIGIDLAIQALKTLIPAEVEKYNDVILLESRYRELNQNLLRGLVNNEDAQIEFNNLRENILFFITDLKEGDFTKKSAAQATSGPKKGKILYRVPDQMQVQKEVKCIVRVAFNEVILMQDLEKISDDSIKDVRIAEVMSAQLVDPNEQKAFNIRTFSEGVQFVDEADFTEWLFYVRPLLEGTYPLLLKICVIEIVDGLERKREVVLEEVVQVTATEPRTESEGTFTTANYQVQLAGTSGGTTTVAPATSNSEQFKKVGMAAMALILFGAVMAIWFYANQGNKQPDPTVEPDRGAAGWRKIRTAGDSTQILEFLKNYPEGMYADSASSLLESLRFTFDTLRQGDSIQFITSHGNYPIQLAVVKGDEPILAQTFSESEDIYLNTSSISLVSETYQVGLTDANGIERTITITVNPKTIAPEEAMVINDTVLNKAVVSPTVVKPKANQKPKPTKPKPVKPKPNQSKNPAQPLEPTFEKVDPPVPSQPVYTFKSVARSPIYQSCYTRKLRRAKDDKLNKELEEARACTKNKLDAYIKSQLSKTPEVIQNKVEKKVNVVFIIDATGKVVVESIKQDFETDFTDKVKEVLEKLPPFIPGQDARGKAVQVRYILPILFKPFG